MRARPVLVGIVALALVLAGCGGGKGTSSATSSGNADECGLTAFAATTKPVQVTMWNSMVRTNATWLRNTVAAFNASQGDVRVRLVTDPSYQDTLTKYTAGLGTGALPELVQLEETTVQRMLDSRSTVPMQACVDADHYSLRDFLPRATAYYSSNGALQAMPWNVSNPVLFYNAAAFRKAGLDPNKPPKTFAELRADAQQIVDHRAATHGIALRIEPYIFEYLNAKSGNTYVNNGNGRHARATAATLDTGVAKSIWTWWDDMVRSGLALNTGGAPGNIDHLLAIGNGDAAMAFEACGVLGTVRTVLESGQYKGVELATAPLPSLVPDGGVPVGDGALWIPKASSPAKRAAAWQFVKYLSSPAQQAALSVAGGYIPVRKSATQNAALQRKWQQDPSFKTGYDQLLAGPTNDASVGSLIGDYQGVRDAARDAMDAMLHGKSPTAALQQAQHDATAKIEEYNTRVAG
jgi:sn-glycerol 3-phosphate transport system substrate-binding protein